MASVSRRIRRTGKPSASKRSRGEVAYRRELFLELRRACNKRRGKGKGKGSC